jgi:hypothetical protein
MFAFLKHRYSSRKQKIMEGHHKKKKLEMKDNNTEIELATITLNDEEISDDRRQLIGKDVDVQSKKRRSKNVRVQTKQISSKDVGVQAELTANRLDDEQTNDQQHLSNEDTEGKSDPSHMLHSLHLTMNDNEVIDPSQIAIVMEDSADASNDFTAKNRPVVEAVTGELNLATTKIIDNIGADLDPIVGYAAEPLLPLSKACAPLNSILHNLSLYVQAALDETPEQPSDGLTIDESAAIRLYTIEWNAPHRSLYSMLNHTLKYDDREHLRPYFKYLKLFITALAKLPCVPPLTVWRGVTKDLSAEFPPETRVTWWAFSSCTTALTVLENNMYLGNAGSRTLFSVEAINGRTIRAHSHFVTEDEILLLPGTHMIVQ